MARIKFSRFFSMIGVGLCLMAAAPQAAHADVLIYTDPDYKFRFSVPDTWTLGVPNLPNTRVRFVSPVPGDHAFCEVATQRDGRFQIYPKRHMHTVMAENFDAGFWQKEAARRYDNPQILRVRLPAGLDKGDAAMAQILYDWNVAERTPSAEGSGIDGDVIRMRSVTLTSVYGDTRYDMTCASRLDKFHRWGELFGSIMASMTLHERYTMFPTGYYRDFLGDPPYKVIPHPGLGTSVRR
ncbi:MAG: hypothetical protein EA357_01175 [Micavibrio sp.]|nr:MAG: hypothetical protein EA357_01175 [Micavibrio sp.]